jgi:capsid portal protein
MKEEKLIHLINLEAINLPKFEEVRGKDWVKYGDKNMFPAMLVDLLNTSAIHGTAIQAKLDATIGEGVIDVGNTIVNSKNETLNDVYEKMAYDYLVFGGYSLNCIWNRGGDAVVELYHIPFNNVRSGKLNEEDEVTDYYYSSDWNNVRKYVPKRYQAFNSTDNKGDNASQIFYYYDYSPASDVYPLPSYMGAVNDIELDARISRFHNANISNGMSPSLLINLPNGVPSPEEQRILHRDLNNSFSGENNAGRVFLTFSDGADRAPQLTPVQSANDSYYVVLEERISSRILTAHRITSPLLIGIRDGGGLGNNAQEIEVAYTHFMSSVIKPIQTSLNKSLGRVTRAMGIEEAIRISPAKLDFEENIEVIEE